MNKRFLTFLMLAVGAAVGCTEEMVDPSEFGEKTIWAVMNEGTVKTRTCVSDDKGDFFGVLWCNGDAIGVYSASGTQNAKFETQIEEPSAKAAFTGSLSGTPAYAYYPYSEANANSSTIKGNLPSVQDFSSADGLLKYDYKLGVASTENKDQFAFDHLFSLLRFTINADGTGVVGEKLQKVEITFPDGVTLNSGAFTVPVNGKATDVKWDATSTEKTLTLNWTDTPAMTAGQTLTGYLNCPSVSGIQGKIITVTLTTSTYVVSFNATVNISSFDAGYVYTFPLTLSKWKGNSGSNYTEEKIEVPSITALSFTAAANPGKILGRKLEYDKSIKLGTITLGFLNTKTCYGSTTYTDSASETTQVMKVDQTEGTITGCIPYLHDRKLIPVIEMTTGAVIMYDNGDGFVEWDGQSEIDFSAGKIIRVSKNGLHRDYAIQVTNTGLPVVVINQPSGDTDWTQTGLKTWAKETEFDDIETSNPGTITVYNADGTINLQTVTSMTRLRGNVSKDYPKKPFAVKLVDDAEVLGMKAHNRWVLLANWKDKSLIRNHIAFRIAQKFTETFSDSTPWQVHGEFVELVYNGVHVGNYYLCEQIKVGSNRLNITKYKAKNFTGDWTAFGYLLESDDYYDEPVCFTTKHYIPFMFKDDVDDVGVILTEVKNMILDIEDKIYKGYKGTSSTGFADAYEKFDLPSMIDQLLIYEMTMNAEFRHPKSLYTYIDHTGDAETNPKYGKLCAGPVWDFDFETFPTLGQSWVEISDRDYNQSIMATPSLLKEGRQMADTPPNITGEQPDELKNDAPFMWYPLLIEDPTFTEMAKERWEKINTSLKGIEDEIDAMSTYLALSWYYNNEMWPIQHGNYSECGTRDYQTQSGFCGDEELGTFVEVISAFKTAFTKRYNGMNDFVPNKKWQ